MFTTFFQIHPATTGLLVDWFFCVGERPGKFVDEGMDRLHKIIQLTLYHYFRGILKPPVGVLVLVFQVFFISDHLQTVFPHVVTR